ncbi:MAG: hypothetical protein NTZ67_01260 [Gammaproteobacteria bacterium]|nr:hypothetical protein [Gammaproteobacteria bacterium]
MSTGITIETLKTKINNLLKLADETHPITPVITKLADTALQAAESEESRNAHKRNQELEALKEKITTISSILNVNPISTADNGLKKIQTEIHQAELELLKFSPQGKEKRIAELEKLSMESKIEELESILKKIETMMENSKLKPEASTGRIADEFLRLYEAKEAEIKQLTTEITTLKIDVTKLTINTDFQAIKTRINKAELALLNHMPVENPTRITELNNLLKMEQQQPIPQISQEDQLKLDISAKIAELAESPVVKSSLLKQNDLNAGVSHEDPEKVDKNQVLEAAMMFLNSKDNAENRSKFYISLTVNTMWSYPFVGQSKTEELVMRVLHQADEKPKKTREEPTANSTSISNPKNELITKIDEKITSLEASKKGASNFKDYIKWDDKINALKETKKALKGVSGNQVTVGRVVSLSEKFSKNVSKWNAGLFSTFRNDSTKNLVKKAEQILKEENAVNDQSIKPNQ